MTYISYEKSQTHGLNLEMYVYELMAHILTSHLFGLHFSWQNTEMKSFGKQYCSHTTFECTISAQGI